MLAALCLPFKLFSTVCKALVVEQGWANIQPCTGEVLSGRKGEREAARRRFCHDSTRVTSALLRVERLGFLSGVFYEGLQ